MTYDICENSWVEFRGTFLMSSLFEADGDAAARAITAATMVITFISSFSLRLQLFPRTCGLPRNALPLPVTREGTDRSGHMIVLSMHPVGVKLVTLAAQRTQRDAGVRQGPQGQDAACPASLRGILAGRRPWSSRLSARKVAGLHCRIPARPALTAGPALERTARPRR